MINYSQFNDPEAVLSWSYMSVVRYMHEAFSLSSEIRPTLQVLSAHSKGNT